MTRRLITTSLALAALALSGTLVGCPSPVEVQLCDTAAIGPVAKVRISGVNRKYTSLTEFTEETFLRVYPYDAEHGKATGEANEPLAIPIGDISPIQPGKELRIEWLTSDDRVLKTESISSLDAWPKRKAKRDGKEVEFYLVRPFFCPSDAPVTPTASVVPATGQPPAEAQVVATLQGLTETDVSRNANRTLVTGMLDRTPVLAFLSGAAKQHAAIDHAPTADDADTSALNWEAWAPGNAYSLNFVARNGKRLAVQSISSGREGLRDFRLPADIPDDLFVGDQCAGRLEWRFILPDGKKALLVHSQDFVLADRATAAIVLRVDAYARQNGRQSLTFNATYPDGPNALYARLRQLAPALPERVGDGFSGIDDQWRAAGGQIESAFQPGTLSEQSSGDPARTAIGARLDGPAQAGLNGLEVTVPWPSLDVIKAFVTPTGDQGSVTGYVTRNYRFNGKLVAILLSRQVDTGVRFDRTVPTTSGGGGSAPAALPAPTITSLSSNSGGGLGTSLTFTGTNFRAGATVTIGSTPATGVIVNSATSVTATLPSLAAGAHAVTVRNTDGTSGISPTNYTVTAPTLTVVGPNNGPVGTSITLTGTNFRAGAAVAVGGTTATVTGRVGTTAITATVPNGLSAGAKNVVVTNSDGTSVTGVGFFTVTVSAPSTDPTITSVTPDGTFSGLWVGGLPFTIVGTNFRAGATVTLNGTDIPGLTVSSTQIDGTIPMLSPGNYTLVVTNTDSSEVTYSTSIFIAP